MLDLAPYCTAKINKLSKIAKIPILKDIISKRLGIKPVDMEKYHVKMEIPEFKRCQEVPVYMSILGKVEDEHNEEGIEMI